jgi:isopentenyl diphosphate isomerase/L-lactate dehydrogenase-like FMN-dependent dehydrogenase
MTTGILGGQHTVAIPIGVSPTAFHKFCHRDAELATARGLGFTIHRFKYAFEACESRKTVMICSSHAEYHISVRFFFRTFYIQNLKNP